MENSLTEMDDEIQRIEIAAVTIIGFSRKLGRANLILNTFGGYRRDCLVQSQALVWLGKGDGSIGLRAKDWLLIKLHKYFELCCDTELIQGTSLVPMPSPLVIDTDCGSDDAMALMATLGDSGRRSCRLVAITCCFGNTTVDHVCQNVLRVLHACEETKVPVYRGCDKPLILHPKRPEIVHGSDGFGDCSHLFPSSGTVEEIPASSALVTLSHNHPGLILTALGPLTNVALAHRLDPDFTSRLNKIIFLGGNYKGIGNTTASAEFNFYCDPEAANIVLTEAKCPVQMVPWETTMEYGIDWDDFEVLMREPTSRARLLRAATKIVAEVCRRDGFSQFLDCDFLAAAATLSPESVKGVLRKFVTVECSGELTRGMVVCQEPQPGGRSIEIVQKFDKSILNSLRKEMVA
ncbi:probable uridine nucleosidase 2 [Nephila pilipes]|uniref:Probable uridine nucleosidase 2 n=1 Tax=Nephila pilipes TaxID=299642 RepID=A0A8X6U5U2_NEPPI|nr:probable uridine nucleosidase 2 [Nephila pilipes]